MKLLIAFLLLTTILLVSAQRGFPPGGRWCPDGSPGWGRCRRNRDCGWWSYCHRQPPWNRWGFCCDYWGGRGGRAGRGGRGGRSGS